MASIYSLWSVRFATQHFKVISWKGQAKHWEMSVWNWEQMADKTNEFELLGFGGESLPTPKAINKRKVSLNSLGSKFKERKTRSIVWVVLALCVLVVVAAINQKSVVKCPVELKQNHLVLQTVSFGFLVVRSGRSHKHNVVAANDMGPTAMTRVC